MLGLTQSYFGWFGGIDTDPVQPADGVPMGARRPAARSSLFILLRGFSSGAVALTGVEAISNGVPAFRRPESKNAADDARVRWRSILGTLFLGVSDPRPPTCSRTRAQTVTVFAQMGKQVFGNNLVLLILQLATAGDPHARGEHCVRDFPRLSSIIARDGYLPAPAREPRRPPRVLERRARACRCARAC